jgi:hypothetical protein
MGLESAVLTFGVVCFHVFVVRLLQPLWCMCTVVTAWVDRRLRSDNPAAMAHGRVALGMMVIRMSLVASFTMDYKFHRTMLVVVTTICSLSALYIHATYLPYYRLVVNQFHTACAAVVCWGALAVALLEIRCLPEVCVDNFVTRKPGFITLPVAGERGIVPFPARHPKYRVRWQRFVQVDVQPRALTTRC